MKEEKHEFSYIVYDSIEELPTGEAALLKKAKEATANSYAPYSRFYVGAAAHLNNGEIITGSNQENASFPVGICAERVLLSSISSQFPNTPIKTIAISYKSDELKSDHPVAPCGICRQTLQEYEQRLHQPIKLILGGETGKIIVIEKASDLLPLGFTSDELR